MYKTVRQGENSLQYTILPQTEEVLMKSGVRGTGRDYSPSINKRKRALRSNWFYCTLFFSGVVVTLMLAAIPIIVVSKTISKKPNFLKQQLKLDGSIDDYIFKIERQDVTSKKEVSWRLERATPSPAEPKTQDIQKTTTHKQLEMRPWYISGFDGETKRTAKPTIEDPVEHSLPVGSIANRKKWRSNNRDANIKPTAAPEHETTSVKLTTLLKKPATPKVMTIEEILITSMFELVPETSTAEHDDEQFHMEDFEELKNSLLSMEDDIDMKDSLAVNTEGPTVTVDDVKVTNMKGRWPFVDVSSYFQWTGYTSRDNLLLPAILLAALAASVFILAVMSLAYHKRFHHGRYPCRNSPPVIVTNDSAKLLQPTVENESEIDN